MKILKFGGTSVGSHQAISQIITILKDKDHGDSSPKVKTQAVVVSAFSGVTDALICMAYAAVAGDNTHQRSIAELAARHRDQAARFLKA